MLDDVIKDKVLTLLDVEIENNRMEKNVSMGKTTSSSGSGINNYSTMKLLTTRLLEDVRRLNKHKDLLTEQLRRKMVNNNIL